jgi:WD40 repeat protein
LKNCHLFTILAIAAFCAVSAAAQTLSNCRTDTPFNANSKPGVVGLELSRDERTILTAGADAKVRYIDVGSGSVVKTLTGHTNSLYKAIYSPDEKLIATSSRDHTARIWDAATGEPLRTLGGFRCAVKAVAFSPDGRTVGASGNDGMLKLWDVKTGRELKSLIHKNSADIDMSTYSFVFDRSGKRIFAANGDGTISEWDVSTGREIANWKAHEPSQIWMAITRDRKRFATIGGATVKIWDARTRQLLKTLEMPRVPGDAPLGGALAFSRDGRLLAASDSGFDTKGTSYLYVQTVVWDAETGKQLFVLKNQKFDIDALQFTRDGHTLLTGSVDATIDFWNTATGRLTRTISLTGK